MRMRTVRSMLMVLALAASGAAVAKAPATQGKACDARNKCGGGLSCVTHGDGKSTCEIACASNGKCPEDQRCVKDGGDMVCRPINDGVGLATATPQGEAPAAKPQPCDARHGCPEDQRCVEDGAQSLCRAITDLDQ